VKLFNKSINNWKEIRDETVKFQGA